MVFVKEKPALSVNISEYDYLLPDDRVAQYPLPERDESKLLIYKEGEILESRFKHIVDYLPTESMLVFNNTKVIHARLFFEYHKHLLEVFCLEPIAPERLPEKALNTKNTCIWACMVGNARKWKEGNLTKTISVKEQQLLLTVRKGNIDDNAYHLIFEWEGEFTFGDVIEAAGAMPLPPYIKRNADNLDENRYQTIFAEYSGSVAAPTAGLHFTSNLLEEIKNNGVKTVGLTLHVGAGTFKPVKSEDISGHEMHEELIVITSKAIAELIATAGNWIAVGTTSLRSLESIYWCGVRLIRQVSNPTTIPQWYAYEEPSEITCEIALKAVLSYLEIINSDKLVLQTSIICAPGYTFHGIRALITNFHQPRSTLMLLVSAFVNGDWKTIYDYALLNQFGFLSYGDAGLLFRTNIKN